MEIQEQRHGAVTVLRPLGPLAQDDADEFKQRVGEVLARSLGRFVVDASSIPYADSKGLEALVDASEMMGVSGHALKLCATTETLRDVLDITNLADLFESFEDVNAAVMSFL